MDKASHCVYQQASMLIHQRVGHGISLELDSAITHSLTGSHHGEEYQVRRCGDYLLLLACDPDGSYTESYYFTDDLSPAEAFTEYIAEKDCQLYGEVDRETGNFVLMRKAYEAMREYLSHFQKKTVQ